MTLDAPLHELQRIRLTVQNAQEDVYRYWQDQVARNFHESTLAPYIDLLRSLESSMRDLSNVMTDAHAVLQQEEYHA